MIILGAGMAGMNAADRAALIRTAEVAHTARRAGDFGIVVPDVHVDFPAVMRRVRSIIDRGSAGARAWLQTLEGVELIEGEARLRKRSGDWARA